MLIVIRSYVFKCKMNLYFLIFFDIFKYFLIFGKKNADVSRTQVVRHMIYIFFGSSLGKENRAKGHHYRICKTDFRAAAFLPPPSPPNREQPQKTHPE